MASRKSSRGGAENESWRRLNTKTTKSTKKAKGNDSNTPGSLVNFVAFVLKTSSPRLRVR
jgi:hypothetical protein